LAKDALWADNRGMKSMNPSAPTPATSLLYPPTITPALFGSAPTWSTDLGLDMLVNAFEVNTRYAAFIRQVFSVLITDPVIIRWRQAVFDDFLKNPTLCEQITALLPILADLQMGHHLLGKRQRGDLLEVADRLAELEMYLNAVQSLFAALQAVRLHSEALQAVRNRLKGLIDAPDFQTLREELPKLQKPLQNISSLTVGINLDVQLHPIAVTLLSINELPFSDTRSLLVQLLGGGAAQTLENPLAPLHTLPADQNQRPLSPVFQDLEKLIAQSTKPVSRALERFVKISAAPLAGLEMELAFFSAAALLISKLRAKGIAFCQPEILPGEARRTVIEALQNILLVVREGNSIPNAVQLDHTARFAILTGPNSGGKTTYLRSVGLAHILAQAGLPIPAQSAQISPIDAIYTHFPAIETQQGRLAEEATRLREICLHVTDRGLVLLNESLSSTTPGEALSLAEEVVAALRAVGVRGIFATHLIELAERIPQIEAKAAGDCRLISLVAAVEQTAEGRLLPTFRIVPGLPLKAGYAQEIARKHGISLEQLLGARHPSAAST
jgi:DNA mismatch repair ATPase MutS